MKTLADLCPTLLLAMLLTAATCGHVTAAPGGELVLRAQCVPRGAIVRLGDVVEVATPDVAAYKQLLNSPLMPSPAPETKQRVTVTQLRDLLSANGVDVSSLRFAGADAVVIEGLARSIEPARVAGAVAERPTRVAAEEQIVAELSQFLRHQTGHEMWCIELEPNTPLVEAFRESKTRPSLAGGKAPWTGRQRFTFQFSDDAPSLGATVKIDRLELVACAVRTIERGDFVRATDVVLRPVGGSVPARSVASLEGAVGKEALQTIRADTVLLANQLRSPVLVRRGERITVKAKASGVVVRTYATAQQDGSLGDLIMVEALEGREKYAARISGVRELEVFAGGAVAGEIAASSR